MPEPNRVQQVSSLNQEGNNLIAGAVLPEAWKRPDQLNLLLLAMWGLDQGIQVASLAVSQQAVEDQVAELTSWPPDQAQEFVEETDSGGQAFDLDPKAPAKEDARVVLEAIRDRVAAS
jgi:hypothetical protein